MREWMRKGCNVRMQELWEFTLWWVFWFNPFNCRSEETCQESDWRLRRQTKEMWRTWRRSEAHLSSMQFTTNLFDVSTWISQESRHSIDSRLYRKCKEIDSWMPIGFEGKNICHGEIPQWDPINYWRSSSGIQSNQNTQSNSLYSQRKKRMKEKRKARSTVISTEYNKPCWREEASYCNL